MAFPYAYGLTCGLEAIEQPLRYSAIAKNRVIDKVLVAMSVKYWMEECWKWVTWMNQAEKIERAG